MNWRKNKVAKKAKHAKHAKGKSKAKNSTSTPKVNTEEKEPLQEERQLEKDKIKVIEQELSQEIKEQKKIPTDKLKKLNNRILKNMMLAIAIILYLLLINMGALNIETITYVRDLKVFSMLFIGITVLIFEISYKKDSGILCIYGIEILILAIITLVLPTLYTMQNEKYGMIIIGILSAFTIYYIVKSIIIYQKERKIHLKNASDINEIIKKK